MNVVRGWGDGEGHLVHTSISDTKVSEIMLLVSQWPHWSGYTLHYYTSTEQPEDCHFVLNYFNPTL